MTNSKCKVIFFGTPTVAASVLEALTKANFCDVVGVVTQPDRAVGRHQSKKAPSPVKIAAQKAKIPVLEGLTGLKAYLHRHSDPAPMTFVRAGIDAGEESQGLTARSFVPLRGTQDDAIPDLGVVVAYGEILPKWLLDHFPLGIVNIHPSLLPKYRGPSPIQAAILNRDQETGVSIIKLDDKMDHGPIIAQEVLSLRPRTLMRGKQSCSRVKEDASDNNLNRDDKIASSPAARERRGPRNDDMTAGKLRDLLFRKGVELLIKVLPDYIAGKITPRPQDEARATYTKKLTKEDGKIDWTKSLDEIEAHIRAMNPWPGAWTEWKGKRLIVWRVSLMSSRPKPRTLRGGVEGSLMETNYHIQGIPPRAPRPPWADSGLGRNDILIEEVQLEGKKKMPFKEFLKGHPDFMPDRR